MDTPAPDKKPLAAALAAFGTWGLMPFLFQAVGRAGASPWETLCWRTIVSVPCAAALVLATRQGGALAGLAARPRQVGLLVLSASLISINWAVYILAVESHHTLAASLGYYINPLFNMAVAAVAFRERVGRPGQIAIALAVAGVALQAAAVGGVPWEALTLAASFGGYSIVRKVAAVEAQTGFLVECLVLGVVAGAYLIWLFTTGAAVFGSNPEVSLLLILTGPATAVPLVCFAYAARRMSLTAISFIQFMTPTMLFAIGAMQGEPLSALRLISFAFIWAGVAVFAWGMARRSHAGLA